MTSLRVMKVLTVLKVLTVTKILTAKGSDHIKKPENERELKLINVEGEGNSSKHLINTDNSSTYEEEKNKLNMEVLT